MPVYRLEVSYDGTGFHGFARQPQVRTVQGEIETALNRVLKLSVETTGAGRTDTGVHAVGQVVSFVAIEELDLVRLQKSLNGILHPEMVVTRLTTEAPGFDARFSAAWREYRYQILNGPQPDPLRRSTTWHVADSLDLEAMNAAADQLTGEHDFASFCRAPSNGGSVRRVLEARWASDPPLVVLRIRANAFCHQMVRSMVGFMVEVGRGRRRAEETSAVIAAADRSAAGPMAPPQGLILWEVGYGD
jgi:tRNA pseudouridine38-40 synthase